LVELTAFKEKYALSAPYIYVAGSFEKRKNHIRVLEAYAQLPSDRPRLVFAGKKNAYLQEMLKLTNKLELADEIHVLQNLPFDELPALYAGAVFTAYLSEFEGFGLPVLESMAVGTPVLTSNISSMPEVGGNAVLYAPPTDVEAIAMQMRLLLFDEERKSELVNQLKSQVNRFSAEIMADQLNALYHAL
jgi:glycosyltransferase involved in cell wall biosynthesis